MQDDLGGGGCGGRRGRRAGLPNPGRLGSTSKLWPKKIEGCTKGMLPIYLGQPGVIRKSSQQENNLQLHSSSREGSQSRDELHTSVLLKTTISLSLTFSKLIPVQSQAVIRLVWETCQKLDG